MKIEVRPHPTTACIALAVLVCMGAAGQHSQHPGVRPLALPGGTGSWHHPIRTNRADVQQLFDHGLALYYGFNREGARRSFGAAIDADPTVPMAHVGLALALGPNLNMDSSHEDLQAACDSSRRALRLSSVDVEHDYATALIARFCDADGRGVIAPQAYAGAMRKLYHERPVDADAATLYAGSLLELRPRTVGQEAELVSVLESVLERHPDHVGANHYYVHAVEGTATPQRARPSAIRLETLATGIGHLVHMPSHIYMRAGEYESSMAVNRRAVASDLAYLRANPPSHDSAMSYLHDLEALAVAAGFAGRFADARLAAEEIARVESELAGTPIDRRFSPPLAFVLLRFHRWREVNELPLPPPDDPPASLLSHFARAIASAALGLADQTHAETDAFIRAARAFPEDVFYRGNPISALRSVFEAVIEARVQAMDGDPEHPVTAWERAVAAQDRLAYHDPSPFYYPIRESLGFALIAAHRPEVAEHVFREELVRNPASGRALFGLWQALQMRHVGAESERIHAAFIAAWAHSDVRLDLSTY